MARTVHNGNGDVKGSERGSQREAAEDGNKASHGWANTEVTAAISGQANVNRFKSVQRDLRSDTLTIQSDAMMLHTLQATRGDDIYEEDETTRDLEERVARLTGKEAALFAPSGTMTNQIAIRCHLKQPPHSIILDHRAHVHCWESGATAVFCQATTHQLFPANGLNLTADEIEAAITPDDSILVAPTKLICLENTLWGTIFPQEEVVKIGKTAEKKGIPVHLDGARVWEVAAREIEQRGMDAESEEDRRQVAEHEKWEPHLLHLNGRLGRGLNSLTTLLEPFSTASLCMSKGLGAPIGSLLVGPKALIDRARVYRKMFGGGVRQIGMVSAAADYALTHNFSRLVGVHKLAKRLEEGLREVGCGISTPVHTNMVFFDPTTLGLTTASIAARLQALPEPIVFGGHERMVLHHQVHPGTIDMLIRTVREMRDELQQTGTVRVDSQAKERALEVQETWQEEPEAKVKSASGY